MEIGIMAVERRRPRTLASMTYKVRVDGGTMYVTVSNAPSDGDFNDDDVGRAFEVFIRIGKSGTREHAHLEGLGRAVSSMLRHGIPAESLIRDFRGILSEPIWNDGELVLSAEDGLGYILQRFGAVSEDGDLGDEFAELVRLVAGFDEGESAVSDGRVG